MEHHYNFTVNSRQGDVSVPRSTIWDPDLSSGAFRLLCLMLEVTGRKPDWKPYSAGFAKMLRISKRTEKYYETELKKAGYMKVEVLQDARGRLCGYRKTFSCAKTAEMVERLKNVPA
jgi:hypothetical protein